MGYWGEGLLENDTAADVADFWETFVARGRERDLEFWTPDRIHELFSQGHLRGLRDFDFRDADRNAEILAIGALFLEHRLDIPSGLNAVLARSANGELHTEQLREWGSPGRRRRVLEEFLQAIGAERETTSPTHPLEVEVAQLQKWSKHYARWINSARTFRADDEWERLEPDFLRALWSFMGTGTDHPREAFAQRAMMYRLMCLAFVTGWFVGLSEEETLAIIERARATKGRVNVAFVLRKQV